MDQLVIQLKGSIDSSNFEKWKASFVAQTQAANRELISDEDYAEASKQVKWFKAAEEALKEAKHNALNQAVEIQQLFQAIDDISNEARQTRLALDKQVKERKQEIKNYHIEQGIECIQAYIEEHTNGRENAEHLDTTGFLNRKRFEEACKGKAGVKGLESAIEGLCDEIKIEISQGLEQIDRNAIKLKALNSDYLVLFQDKSSLLSLPENALEQEIQTRIAHYQHIAHQVLERKGLAQSQSRHTTSSVEKLADTTETFQIVVSLVATKAAAQEIARTIKNNLDNNPKIEGIKLTRSRPGGHP